MRLRVNEKFTMKAPASWFVTFLRFIRNFLFSTGGMIVYSSTTYKLGYVDIHLKFHELMQYDFSQNLEFSISTDQIWTRMHRTG